MSAPKLLCKLDEINLHRRFKLHSIIIMVNLFEILGTLGRVDPRNEIKAISSHKVFINPSAHSLTTLVIFAWQTFTAQAKRRQFASFLVIAAIVIGSKWMWSLWRLLQNSVRLNRRSFATHSRFIAGNLV